MEIVALAISATLITMASIPTKDEMIDANKNPWLSQKIKADPDIILTAVSSKANLIAGTKKRSGFFWEGILTVWIVGWLYLPLINKIKIMVTKIISSITGKICINSPAFKIAIKKEIGINEPMKARKLLIAKLFWPLMVSVVLLLVNTWLVMVDDIRPPKNPDKYKPWRLPNFLCKT